MAQIRVKGYGYIVVLLLFIASLSSLKNLFNEKRLAQVSESSFPQKAFVTRVIDGDTIVIESGYRIRYIGINTPETKHPEKPVEYFGKEALEFNKNLVMGKEIILEYDAQKLDKYGRLLAYVYVDGIFVNAKLAEEGYAQVFTMPPNIKYVDLFLGMQKKARADKKGFWQNPPK